MRLKTWKFLKILNYFNLINIAIAKNIIITPTAIKSILIMELTLSPEELDEIPNKFCWEYPSVKVSCPPEDVLDVLLAVASVFEVRVVFVSDVDVVLASNISFWVVSWLIGVTFSPTSVAYTTLKQKIKKSLVFLEKIFIL